MSIQLKLTHEEGLRLRQQQASDVERTEDKVIVDAEGNKQTLRGGLVVRSKDWKFVRGTDNNGHPTEDVQQDEDPRRVDGNGKKLKMGTYTLHVTAGIRNLVVERKGKVTPYNFKNPAVRNQIRVKYQTLEKSGRKTKDGKDVHEWKDSGLPQYFPPNAPLGVFVGDAQRAIVDEMPT
jgi:hypothetical protein